MKLNNCPIIWLCIITVILVGCKKTKSTSRQNILIGKWERVRYAFDANHNGIIDSNEESSDVGPYLSFSADGNGEAINDTTVYELFSWKLLNGDSMLEFKVNTTVSDHIIDSLTVTTLVYRYNNDSPISWGIFIKQ